MKLDLKIFKTTNSFEYTSSDNLELVCNAPESSAGVFLVYDVIDQTKELIMVGSTGTVHNDGSLKIKSGLFDKIVNGSQFTKSARKFSWPTQMKKEDINKLEVIWYETFNNEISCIPTSIEGLILQDYYDTNSKLPRWNVAF